MIPNPKFAEMPKPFWANVKSLSQAIGYSGKGVIKRPDVDTLCKAFLKLDLNVENLQEGEEPTKLALDLVAYFEYRADVLENYVEPRLMNSEEAKAEFSNLRNSLSPHCPLPMNKQKGEKKAHAYLTCIVNMLVEKTCNGVDCDFDPRQLATITLDGRPIRTLSRRVDGAFPSTINPIALWEIKEYYYTTTFGSRVADGVYESLLDGLEIEEIREHVEVDILHYLMIDAHYTWWECGKSYLCRIVDMLHMGYVDEVFFGREVIERLPEVVDLWIERHNAIGDEEPINL